MEKAESVRAEKTKPFLVPEFCKGCNRCVSACTKHCIEPGHGTNRLTGLSPVELHLDDCTACGLCMAACPEPYGLRARPAGADEHAAPEEMARVLAERREPSPQAIDRPSAAIPVPELQPLVLKGTYASAVGALFAGCRHVFGYPITPSTEGTELMAKILPELDGVFVQAVSEVATVNMMYGCAAAGLPSMTFTSSPGFSLMLEGISYMIGAELPGVFVNIMRGGPGLGNIGPEQADIKLACRGLGHGNTHAIVLAPASPQEMLDLTRLAFELTFRYRNPVVLLGDGYLGQMTGKVVLPSTMTKPGLPAWAVWGDAEHRRNLVSSIHLSEADLEAQNVRLNEKYRRMGAEARAELFHCEDAEVLVVACNTPARMARGAVRSLREQGLKVGLFRPVTVWPFPIAALLPLLPHVARIVVVEASPGQLEDELRLALSHAGVDRPPGIESVQRYGGVLPQQSEIVAAVVAGAEVAR